MNDAGPHVRAGKLLKVIRECVGERAGRRARRRMDHQSGRFIYDNQRLIFVNDLDRNVFRRKDVRRRSNQLHFDLIVFAEFVKVWRACLRGRLHFQ